MKSCWYVNIRQKAKNHAKLMAWPGFQGKCPPLKKCANVYFRIVNSGQCFFTLYTYSDFDLMTCFNPLSCCLCLSDNLVCWFLNKHYYLAQIENIQINFSYNDEYNKDLMFLSGNSNSIQLSRQRGDILTWVFKCFNGVIIMFWAPGAKQDWKWNLWFCAPLIAFYVLQ